jgi:hypothetical protein
MSLPANAIVHYIADDDAKYAQEIIDAGLASGFTDIFEAGLLTYNFK